MNKHLEGALKVLEIETCVCDPTAKTHMVYELQPAPDTLVWKPVCPIQTFERLYPDRVHELA